MASCFREQVRRWDIGTVLPIPLHPARRRKRGYNQAEIVAAELASCLELPVRKDVLFRIRNTKPQKQLDSRERPRNMKGAFGVSGSWKTEPSVLLIDDIYTTGATMEQAAKILRTAGVQNVYFLTISIGQGI